MTALGWRHWVPATSLALVAHLAAGFMLFGAPGAPPSGRGGGLYEEGGESADGRSALLVALGQPGAGLGDEEAVEEPDSEVLEALEPAESAEQAAAEVPEAPADVAEAEATEEPEAPVAAEPEASAAETAETSEAEGEESAEREPEAEVAALPAPPTRKPSRPLVQPDLVAMERRLPVQGPAPAPQAQPPAPANKATAAASPQAGEEGESEQEFTLFGDPSRLGDASGNEFGAVRQLNYQDRVFLWLKRHGAYPRDSFRYRHEGTVLLKFGIDRTGRITYYEIAKSSGYHLLDQAVHRMMRRSSPVPPIPPEIAENELHFTVPVVFRRERSTRRARS